MSAYVVASINITDSEAYAAYPPKAAETIIAHGGEILAADLDTTSKEGLAPKLTVVVRFDDKDVAEAWYHSDDYQAVLPIRHSASTGTLVIADGFVPPAG